MPVVLWLMASSERSLTMKKKMRKERPIIFSGEMVRAILDGRKTQTRRVVKWHDDFGKEFFNPVAMAEYKERHRERHDSLAIYNLSDGVYDPECDDRGYIDDWGWAHDDGGGSIDIRCPYGIPGDRLWVRETWATPKTCDAIRPSALDHGTPIRYRSVQDKGQLTGRWRPSIHMPRWASRITLEVVDVRVEMVQEIDNNDAYAEGTPDLRTMENNWEMRDCFAQLWDSINAKRGYSWASNPWVWVVEFKKVEKKDE